MSFSKSSLSSGQNEFGLKKVLILTVQLMENANVSDGSCQNACLNQRKLPRKFTSSKLVLSLLLALLLHIMNMTIMYLSNLIYFLNK